MMKTSKIIAGLLALLGFSGCDGGKVMYGPAPVEYGSPYADFELKGVVTDNDGNPVKAVKVTMSVDYDTDFPYILGETVTDAAGKYAITDSNIDIVGEITVAVEDVDGDANGGDFASQETELKIAKGDYVGGSGWYRGKVTKTADFTLTPKQPE